jgi:hypothetical protein
MPNQLNSSASDVAQVIVHHPPYCEGLHAISGSIKNEHLLYALFHVLESPRRLMCYNWPEGSAAAGEPLYSNISLSNSARGSDILRPLLGPTQL